jgi:hypothetical protein
MGTWVSVVHLVLDTDETGLALARKPRRFGSV